MKLLIQAVFNLNSYVSAYPETAIGEFGSLFLISDYHCFRQLFPAKLIIIRKFYARLHIAGMDYHANCRHKLLHGRIYFHHLPKYK